MRYDNPSLSHSSSFTVNKVRMVMRISLCVKVRLGHEQIQYKRFLSSSIYIRTISDMATLPTET